MRYILTTLLCFLLSASARGRQESIVSAITKAQQPASGKPAEQPIASPGTARTASDTIVTDAVQRVEEITKMLNQVNNTLRRGFDTSEISSELPESERLVKVLRGGILSNRQVINIRSLNALHVILLEMEQVHDRWQKSLSAYSRTINDMSTEINNILHDSVLNRQPKDPALQVLYTSQLAQLNKKWLQADTANRMSLLRIGMLQNRVANNYIAITDMLDEVEFKLTVAQKNIFKREEPNIWDTRTADYPTPFHTVAHLSLVGGGRVLAYYFEHNWSVHTLCILMFILYYGWLLSSIRRIRRHHPDKNGIFANTKFASHQPLLTSLVFTFTIGSFLYTNPPTVFLGLVWLAQTVCITLILMKASPPWLRLLWFLLLLIYTGLATLNMMMLSSLVERWAMLVLELSTLAACHWFLRKNPQSLPGNPPPYQRLVVWLTVGMTVAAIIANMFGRVMLSRFFALSAVFSLISAQSLVTLVQLLFETFYLHVEANKNNSRFAAFLDFNRIRQGLRSTLYTLAAIGWLIVLLRNLNIYFIIRDAVLAFLEQERKIGNTSFSFSSIFIFIVVIWLAFLISKAMVIVFGHHESNGGVKKNRWNSAVILVRLAVLAAGVLLAFAASGIPMDKLTIIIGALSVGIGFGLQNIVNNLVSGVILAFEKPVEIGDVIDIGTESGTVKEIGIRASKIATVDGSEIIVPNGDLLSQHITNWTLTSRMRRVELFVGVAYGTDLQQAAKLLGDVVRNQEGVQSIPEPLILLHKLNDSSVDFRLLFWADIGTWIITKSDLLAAIYDTLAANNIEIPFPQQDVHIRRDENTDN
ncbi:mechanosensitive ion channel family protein [Chitinophaga lutea]